MNRLPILLALIPLLACACQPAPLQAGQAYPATPTAAQSFSPSPADPGQHISPTAAASPPPASPTPSPLPPEPTPAPPSPSPSPTSTPRRLTSLLFTGVIVPARCVQAAIDERQDANYPYDEVREIIQDADLAVGTFNATMSDYPPHTGCKITYVLVGSPGNADAARQAGFDVMSVATNHIKNCGLTNCGNRAFFDTLDNLRRVGILPVGAGANHAEAMQPVVVTLNGVRFGIVSLGQIEPMAFAGEDTPGIAVLTPENLKAAIDAARQVSDVVIAMPHWGPEDVPIPNWIQRDLALELVEAGADLVVGNHTHVVQARQEIDGVPVFYGLGNFVFDQGLRDHQQGVILQVYFDGQRLAGYDFIPTHVDRDGTVHIAEAAEAAEVLERIDSSSRELDWDSRPSYLPSLPLAEAQGLSAEELTHRLFEDWLSHFQNEAWTWRDRITAYEVESIAMQEDPPADTGGFDLDSSAEITFSVRPLVTGSSAWEDGNGTLDPDKWVRGKRAVTGIRQFGGRCWLVVFKN